MALSQRKQQENEALRRRVLDAAEDIIVREGLQKVTMRRIAAAIDYAPTVLYRLFAGKDDLIDHLIDRGYAGVRARYAAVMDREDLAPRDQLSRILASYVAYALEHPNHYHMWFVTSDIRLEEGVPRMHHGHQSFTVFRPWLVSIDGCLRMGMWPGRERLEVFQTLWARVHGMIALRLQHRDFPWLPVAQQLATVMDLGEPGA